MPRRRSSTPKPNDSFRVGRVTVFWRGLWAWARYSVDGKGQHREALNTMSPRHAKIEAERIHADLVAGDKKRAERKKIRLETAVQEYLSERRHKWRPRTYQKAKAVLEHMASIIGREYKLTAVTREMLHGYYNHLYEHGAATKRESSGGHSAGTVEGVHPTVRAFFSWYTKGDDRILQESPAAGIGRELAKTDVKNRRAAPAEDMDKLLTECRKSDHLLFRIVAMCWYGGLRAAEALSREWIDFDCDWKDPSTPAFLQITEKPEIEFKIKVHEEGIIPVPPELVDALAPFSKSSGWVVEYTREYRGKRNDKNGHKPVDKPKIYRLKDAPHDRLKAACKRAKIPYWTFQEIRRGYATRLSEYGEPAEIQSLLRHKNIKTTMRYIVRRPEQHSDLVNRAFAKSPSAGEKSSTKIAHPISKKNKTPRK